MMKRTIVVFGVLVAFLFATSGAYAVENNTWGKIKASFVEAPEKATDEKATDEKATDDPQLLPDSEEAPRVAKSAKTEKGKEDSSTTEEEDSPTYTKEDGRSRYAKAPR